MRVFVSSTYLDLKDYRQAVDEIVNRLSLQYRGMEYFGSRPFEPNKVCFDEISQCQLFVGIYAHRYGYIPEGHELSITEQEFDFASNKGLECYCYVLEPTFPWPPPFIEHDASSKLQKFLAKVSRLVRSTFTTPDNLAKQVATDLSVAVERIRPADTNELRKSLEEFCKHEIATTIGPKYIRELYVGRKLNSSVKKEIQRTRQIGSSIKSIRVDVKEIYGRLVRIRGKKLSKEERESLHEVRKSLRQGLRDLNTVADLQFPNVELCYPATRLNASLSLLREGILEGLRSISRRLVENRIWDEVCPEAVEKIANLERALRPITLIVDRAGGGKTNLLCHLAEEIDSKRHCLFFSAKSVPDPSEDGIVDYLSSVYRISKDPIETAAATVTGKDPTPVVIILDGINENFEPLKFNAAVKALVRRYYGKPVRWIVSCRDIYWNYFEDGWWQAHCGLVSRDELYEFTTSEFRKALPLYLKAYDIEASPVGNARDQLHHPLLLRFYCEAFKGKPGKPSRLGRVEDIRLLELFDAYCDRKFQQIKERLGLISSDEIYSYLQIIARLMLTEHTRLLPVRRIGYQIRSEFQERTLRSIDSRYVQILDEDILLEQKPSGPELDLMVSFVYDEFMEYVIAKALWSEMCERVGVPDYEEVKHVANSLLDRQKLFISVLGIVVYLGELLATQSVKDGLNYIRWLISEKQEMLACRLFVRWPMRIMSDSVFLELIKLHQNSRNARIQSEAWRALEKLCLHHWKIFFDYITGMQLAGYSRPMFIFSSLGRVNGGPDPRVRLESVRWIVTVLKRVPETTGISESGDYKSGLTAIKRIIANTKTSWTEEQFSQAEKLLQVVLSFGSS
jgi:Domain of unknown function (DUF4062)/NACHT domain